MDRPARIEDGICETCGYALTHGQSVCPECGARIDWERQRTRMLARPPRGAMTATLIACIALLALTALGGAASGMSFLEILLGVGMALVLEVVVIAGLGVVVRGADRSQGLSAALWWCASAPIWIASTASLVPIHIVDWFMRGGTPARPDAQDGLSILFVCIIFNAFSVVSAGACAAGFLARFVVRPRARRPIKRSVALWAFGVPGALLLALILFGSPTAGVGILLAIVVPVGAPIGGWVLVGSVAQPHPPVLVRGAGARSGTVSALVGAVVLSAIACGAFNFWWNETCLLSGY